MMYFEYFQPLANVRPLVGSYYGITVPDAFADVMRAEIANIRFILKGTVYSDINGEEIAVPAGSMMLCGPTYRWSNIRFEDDTLIFGVAVTPLGWARMFGMPANAYADKILPFEDVLTPDTLKLAHAVFEAPDMAARAACCDALFAKLDDPDRSVNEAFLEQVTNWITDPEPNELEDLLSSIDLSLRQVERLSKLYFGSAPKKLHRKFRALHSANRLTWQELTDWRDVATTAYFDQSHFIREFKQFNGRTPNEFIEGAHLLVRLTLQERLQIDHDSPFSLVG